MDHIHLKIWDHFLLVSLTMHMPFELVIIQRPWLPPILWNFSPNSPIYNQEIRIDQWWNDKKKDSSVEARASNMAERGGPTRIIVKHPRPYTFLCLSHQYFKLGITIELSSMGLWLTHNSCPRCLSYNLVISLWLVEV